MSVERTFSIIKPDAVANRHIGDILAILEKKGFRILAMRQTRLTAPDAEGFYAVHRGKPFFAPLTEFMSSGKVMVMVLEADNAIARWRDVMGATDPAKAAPGTIRKEFGSSIQNNCTHGSDAAETAAFEIGYLFPGLALI